MKIKEKRQQTIRDLLRSRPVSSQEELQQLLLAQGLSVPQPTLSRDLKDMHVVKVPDGGGYRYRIQGAGFHPGAEGHVPLLATCVKSLEFAGSLLVIHTLPGYSAMVAAQMDANAHDLFAGTIAGDDTVFAALRDGHAKEQVKTLLFRALPGLEDKWL